MKIGVVSDTHGYFDPRLARVLSGVDEILHAGDVGSIVVMDELRVLAPVHAVRGNVDGTDLNLPPALTVVREGVFIYVAHTVGIPQSKLADWARTASSTGNPPKASRDFLADFPAECNVVVFGHSHEPCALTLDGKLFFNPGAAGKKRFSLPRCCGILEISRQGVHATFLDLDSYNTGLPEAVYLPRRGERTWGS